MKKSAKKYYLAALGVIFLLVGTIVSIEDGDWVPFICFGIGTLAATALYYGIMIKRPQVMSFAVGLIVLHTGVIMISKGDLSYPLQFGLITFTGGILVLLNSGFSEYLNKRKRKI